MTIGRNLIMQISESKVIPSIKIKINGKIKKAIDAYSRKKVEYKSKRH